MTRLTDEELRQLFEDDPTPPEPWESTHSRLKRAERALGAILECQSTDALPWLMQAIAARGLGRDDLADELLRKVEDAVGRLMDGDG